jgi:hypothetical protein
MHNMQNRRSFDVIAVINALLLAGWWEVFTSGCHIWQHRYSVSLNYDGSINWTGILRSFRVTYGKLSVWHGFIVVGKNDIAAKALLKNVLSEMGKFGPCSCCNVWMLRLLLTGGLEAIAKKIPAVRAVMNPLKGYLAEHTVPSFADNKHFDTLLSLERVTTPKQFFWYILCVALKVSEKQNLKVVGLSALARLISFVPPELDLVGDRQALITFLLFVVNVFSVEGYSDGGYTSNIDPEDVHKYIPIHQKHVQLLTVNFGTLRVKCRLYIYPDFALSPYPFLNWVLKTDTGTLKLIEPKPCCTDLRPVFPKHPVDQNNKWAMDYLRAFVAMYHLNNRCNLKKLGFPSDFAPEYPYYFCSPCKVRRQLQFMVGDDIWKIVSSMCSSKYCTCLFSKTGSRNQCRHVTTPSYVFSCGCRYCVVCALDTIEKRICHDPQEDDMDCNQCQVRRAVLDIDESSSESDTCTCNNPIYGCRSCALG